MIQQITYDISTLVPYVNWIYFYYAWGVGNQGSMEREKLRQEADQRLSYLDGKYHTHAVFGLFDANSDGDDVVVWPEGKDHPDASVVFIGPCACFTNDKYPVRINYDLQGPRIRRGASIGGNTTFLSNVEIGEGAIVAAGAIVIHSVPPFYLAIGTPARIKPLPDHLKVPNRF